MGPSSTPLISRTPRANPSPISEASRASQSFPKSSKSSLLLGRRRRRRQPLGPWKSCSCFLVALTYPPHLRFYSTTTTITLLVHWSAIAAVGITILVPDVPSVEQTHNL